MTVQDDQRERELVRMFNLHWDPTHQRAGVDATLDLIVDRRLCRFEVEVKSTTNKTVSTARDVGMEHIQKWRRKLFIIGFYSHNAHRPELQRCLCLTPMDMEPWIASIETKISIDFHLANLASRRLQIEDLHAICDARDSYPLDVAKKIHKQQWTKEQYQAALDIVDTRGRRVSRVKMLEILQLRAKYIAERGATLNNPHITKSHLDVFANTNRVVIAPNWAQSVRDIATEFVRTHPEHPSIHRD